MLIDIWLAATDFTEDISLYYLIINQLMNIHKISH